MSKAAISSRSGNVLLDRLPLADFKRLPLQALDFEPKKYLYRVREPVEFVFFPASGIISAMAVMSDGSAIEVATIGKEGMSGLSTHLGTDDSPYEVMVQVPGHGWQLDVQTFREEASRKGAFQKTISLYHTAFSLQVSYSVACNGLHKIEQRCCRWLLMTQDRVGENILPLTHEFLAIMLGVRRASVTEVLQPLQQRGAIKNERGFIEILDRPALESLSCECYRAVTGEFSRLFD